NMTAFYDDPASDEWPVYAMEVQAAKINGNDGWVVNLYDDEARHRIHVDSIGSTFDYITSEEHGLGVCPVVRWANQLDLEGRSAGEVEPFIPVAARIDQTVFDRLVVQRFASWVVRTVAGM